MRHVGFGVAALALCLSVPVLGQMGDPSAGPTKIPNQNLDPTRSIQAPALESTLHQPLAAEYIWTREDSVPANAAARSGWNVDSGDDLGPHYFRRTFDVKATPEHATLYVAGPRSAVIYLNGQRVGGYQLNLDSPLSIRVYAVDVTKDLRAGSNVLAMEAARGPERGNGANSRQGMQLTRGLVLAAKIVPAVRGAVAPPLVVTDAQWKAAMHAAGDWRSAAFDASGWEDAESVGGIESSINFFQWNVDAGMYAWPGYDGISPFLARYPLAPVVVSHVYAGTGSIDGAEGLAHRGAGGAGLRVELPAKSVREANAPQILLDFGREVDGRIEFQSASSEPADVTVQYGESEGEAMREPYLGVDPVHIAPEATAYGPKSAFRYALIRFTGGKNIRYKSIALDGIYYPVKYEGSFESSDARLNQMWTIGAYTAHLCMLDDIWDAPKRDRGRWMGDLEVSGRTIEDAFGGGFLMDDTLDRLLGPAPVKEDVNGIPGYSAFWVVGEAEYYRHHGSMQQLESTHERLVQLLRYMKTEMDARALFTNAHHAWPFVDWSPDLYGDTPESRAATQFEFYHAFREGAWLLRQVHDTANAEAFDKDADAMQAAAQKHLLDPSGAFGTRWQVNAYAVVSGAADATQYPAIWRGSLSTVGEPKYDGLEITPYYNYYIVSAMAEMGHRQAALNWIRNYWGAMTNEGATSFWEGYSPDWYKGSDFHASLQADAMSGYRVSLAHGWSSGVTPWLMEQVLGIHAREAGFSHVFIRPDLIDLQWARGAEPTPRGLLGVGVRKSGAGDVVTIDLPAGVEASVSVPVAFATAKVLVNGKPQASTAAEGGQRAMVTLSGAGRYEIRSR
ncbi:MAG: alpha-L-rhamnosidase C-terminal domain-containing protein [Acidobacteriaceae bacterium]